MSRPLKPHERSYPTLSPDTDPAAEAVQLEIYRRMSTEDKLKRVAEAIMFNRAATMAGIRSRHPNAEQDEVERRYFDLVLGEELAAKAYGPFPDRWKTDE